MTAGRTCAQQRDLAKAEKRGGGRQFIPLDAGEAERRLGTELAHALGPDTLFDQKRGVTVLAQALESVRLAYTRSGQDDELHYLIRIQAL